MKKWILLTLISVYIGTFANAQLPSPALDFLDINQGKGSISAFGDLFLYTGYEIPINSGKRTIYGANIWIGGLDSGSALHVAGQTYRQSGDDFFPGPVMNSNAYSTANDSTWNKVWKINKTTIDSFLMWRANPGNFPTYSIPPSIMSWPANGDVQQGQAVNLAPFIDYNGDNYYDPLSGDYPCIKGDQALFVIFNDDRNLHTETGGTKFTIEVHAMLYAYSAPGTYLDSTVFLNYKVFNRSAMVYDSVYLGQWTDFDLGDAFDDYGGCNVPRHLGYVYNADSADGISPVPTSGTYGIMPPAQGLLVLRGPSADPNDGMDNNRDGIIDEPGEPTRLNYFMMYNNNFSVTGNPSQPDDYYSYYRRSGKIHRT